MAKRKRLGRPKGSKNKTKSAKAVTKRKYSKKEDIYPISRGIYPTKNAEVSPAVKRAVNTILYMDPKVKDGYFDIPNNKENGLKLQSIYWSVKQQLKKINKNITISTQTLGQKSNPSGIRIWRLN